MSSIEEKILESLAWEEGSPLLVLLEDKLNQLAVANPLLGANGSANGNATPNGNANNNKGLQSLASPGIYLSLSFLFPYE